MAYKPSTDKYEGAFGKVRDAKVYTRSQEAAALVPALTAYPRTAELLDETTARRAAAALIGA